MFPRKSAVVKVVFCTCVSLLVIVLYVTGPSGSASSLQRVFEDIQSYGLDETQLQAELVKLSGELNVTYDAHNKTLIELYRVVQAMREKIPVNPHKFRFVSNPAALICPPGKPLFLLIYVHTAPAHYKRRAIIRETWGNPQNLANLNIKLVFLLGLAKDKALNDAIGFERDLHGDIVQEDFLDSYRNLTYKAIMGLRWVSVHCPSPRFVLKVDDDIFVNIFNIVNHLQALQEATAVPSQLLLCLVWYRMKVVRDPKSKWYLSKAEFQPDYFPTYCSGSAFVMTPDVMAAMYNASRHTPFFWVDDFYVTGLLAQKVGVVHKKFNSVYTLGPSTFLEKFSDESKWRTYTFGHVHNLDHLLTVWRRVLDDKRKARYLAAN